MDNDLSHEALRRFSLVEADIKKVLDHLDLTSTADDQAKAAEESAQAAAPPSPPDPRDAEIAELKKQLEASKVPEEHEDL